MNQAVMRCKMKVQRVTQEKEADGSIQNERVELNAVYGTGDTENAKWSKWTPSASFTITINNPAAFNQLSKGHEFYVDFIPA